MSIFHVWDLEKCSILLKKYFLLLHGYRIFKLTLKCTMDMKRFTSFLFASLITVSLLKCSLQAQANLPSYSEASVQPGETQGFDFIPMEEITEIAEAYSEDAIEAGKKFFDVDLDRTKESITHVSDILNLLHKTKKKERPSKENILMQAKIYGSYVGEVYRRHYPAEWGVVKLGEDNVPALKCKITGAFFFPWGKAQQQIMNGDEDNVAVYYHVLEQEVLPKLKH